MGALHRADPPCVPRSGEAGCDRLGRALPLSGTPGQAYVERRGIPVEIADAAGVRFDADWNGRPAVLVGMFTPQGTLAAVHGRYLEHGRGRDKMLTVGGAGGVVCVGAGWCADPLILVEGLFDALSLAVGGFGGVATLGRWAAWLPQACERRVVWLGFDGNRPGDGAATEYARRMPLAVPRRLPPPARCKDWNTALRRCGRVGLSRWIRAHVAAISAGSP